MPPEETNSQSTPEPKANFADEAGGSFSNDVDKVDIIEGGSESNKPADEPAVSFADFASTRNDSKNLAPVTEKKTAEVKTAETEIGVKGGKEEDTEEDDKLKEEQDKLILPKPGQSKENVAKGNEKKAVVPRDYTGIDPAHKVLFERMSNDSFNALKPIYAEHRKLKTENEELKSKSKVSEYPNNLPPSYFDHPEGYMLSPEFKTLDKQLNVAEQISSHWETQLARIEDGLPWRDLSMDKDGRLQFGAEQDPTTDAKVEIRKYLRFTNSQYQKLQSKHEEFLGSFKTKQKEDVGKIEEAISQFFPGYDKDEHPTREYQKKIISLLPTSYQPHPVTKLFSILAAQHSEVVNAYKALLNKGKTAESIAKDSKAAPPKKNEFVNAGGGGSGAAVKFSDFNRERAA